MVSSYPGQRCAMAHQIYCSEQIAIPESFPNILKTFAKAAIRTQPYDILRWSAAYFRCLANNALPPAKIRLERDCRQGCLTRGYLKVLVAQVGKGFFISRCLLQERWKALCLPEEDLLKYLSLCRMLNWPQVHWLKLLAVLAGSLNETLPDTMAMVCELLSDDVEGGLARIPFWMFKTCYTFAAKLDCSQELCFVNGQMVLPWGDLEEFTSMQSLPRVLSATLLKDTIIASCKAQFETRKKCFYGEVVSNESISATVWFAIYVCYETLRQKNSDILGQKPDLACTCPPESSKRPSSSEVMGFNLGDPKELIAKCDDFNAVMSLLLECQGKPLTEEDFKGPHYISEKQLKKAQKIEGETNKERQKLFDQTAEHARNTLQQEPCKMLREVGPPWTWLHQFTVTDCNTASYNFIDQESFVSDVLPEVAPSHESSDVIKGKPKSDKDEMSRSSSTMWEADIEERKASLESLKSLIEEANNQDKCDVEKVSSIVYFLKSEELGVLQRAGGPFATSLNLKDIIDILERADAHGVTFSNVEQLIGHIQNCLLGDVNYYSVQATKTDRGREKASTSSLDETFTQPCRNMRQSVEIPPEWHEKSPVAFEVHPQTPEEKPTESLKTAVKEPLKDNVANIFENTVGLPPEQIAKMPKHCFETKDEDELILGLDTLSEVQEEKIVKEDETGSEIPDSGEHSNEGYIRVSSLELDEDEQPSKEKPCLDNLDYFCCIDAPSLKPKTYMPPLLQFKCSIQPLPGIGPTVPQKIIDDFLAFLRVRSRSQRGLINPRNFKEDRCPYMIDTNPHESN